MDRIKKNNVMQKATIADALCTTAGKGLFESGHCNSVHFQTIHYAPQGGSVDAQ